MQKRIPLSVGFVLRALAKLYPNADCTLDWRTPLELLIATILAAQCTDARVNIVTKKLFQKYTSPQDYLRVSLKELERDIHSCGTFRMKARAIQESCSMIIDTFHGEVPRTMAEMLELRGVGRKTASIVLATAYGIIDGIPIDTHCIRLTQRMGLTKFSEQSKIENDLMKRTPHKDWVHLSHLLVAHGRAVCIARRPACERCVLKEKCPSSFVKK